MGGARASQKMLVNLNRWIVSCGVLAFKKHVYLDDFKFYTNSNRLRSHRLKRVNKTNRRVAPIDIHTKIAAPRSLVSIWAITDRQIPFLRHMISPNYTSIHWRSDDSVWKQLSNSDVFAQFWMLGFTWRRTCQVHKSLFSWDLRGPFYATSENQYR